MATKTVVNKKDEAKPRQAVAVLQPTRMPIAPRLAEDYNITAPQWRVLVDQIFPSARTVEAVLMALEYCRHRNLDIFKRPVHIVPMYSTQLGRMVETVWPGVAEIRTTAHRTKAYAGMDNMIFGPDKTVQFDGEVKQYDEQQGRKVAMKVSKIVTFPEWVEVTVYRLVQGVRCPFPLRTYWEEAYADMNKSGVPNDMWERRPRGQLMKCGEVASLRMAFPEELGSEYAAEEMEGKVIEMAPVVVSPASGPPTAVPTAAEAEVEAEAAEDKPENVDGDLVAPYLQALETSLDKASTVEEVEAAWDHANPQVALSDNEKGLTAAFALKKGRIAQFSTTDKKGD